MFRFFCPCFKKRKIILETISFNSKNNENFEATQQHKLFMMNHSNDDKESWHTIESYNEVVAQHEKKKCCCC